MATYGYIRVSSDDQKNDGYSLDAQKQKITTYCELKKLGLPHFYADEGVSGFKTLSSRQEGSLLLHILRRGDNIVVIKLDRLFRNTKDALQVCEDFEAQGINLHLLDMSIDTSTAIGKMFFTLVATFAQFERDITGERTKTVLDKLRHEMRPFNHTPYGYQRDGNKLKHCHKEILLMSRIKDLHTSGNSLGAIKQILDSEHIKPKYASSWSRSSIYKIINT